MERKYKYVGNGVIENCAKHIFLTKADGTRNFEKKFYDEEATFSIAIRDIEIDMESNGHFVEAVLMTFYDDSDETKTKFLDMIISTHIGTFISDWY